MTHPFKYRFWTRFKRSKISAGPSPFAVICAPVCGEWNDLIRASRASHLYHIGARLYLVDADGRGYRYPVVPAE
jgi:hypothetical protein